MKELLKNLQIFSDFNEIEINVIGKYFSLKKYNLDENISGVHDINQNVFIVSKGKIVNALNIPGSINRKHGEYGPGDFFSGISLLGDKPLSENNTFYAAEKSELLMIAEKSILELIENKPDVAIKFITQLLSITILQLRKSSKFLADVVQWGENASRRVITDELTGLYNRAFLDDALENFFNISKSNKKALSLLMVDIDNFGKINEKFGHEMGNKVLIEVVNLIKNIISKHGIIARYGGDEYSILLPETDLQKGIEIAESIRLAVESFNFSAFLQKTDIPITTSIGISTFPDTATDILAFKEKADDSLYQAKESGRNRVAYVK